MKGNKLSDKTFINEEDKNRKVIVKYNSQLIKAINQMINDMILKSIFKKITSFTQPLIKPFKI